MAFLIVNFPFPHEAPFGEIIFATLNIPIGINTAGTAAMILLVASIISLMKSLNKFKGIAGIISILFGLFLPPFLADSYQKYLATGIYAIKYDYNSSNCNFEKMNDATIHLQCTLAFENFSSNDVHFTVEFYDPFMMIQFWNS